MRKIILFTLVLILCISFGIAPEAASSIRLNIDGKVISFDESTGYPFISADSHTMMPLRVCLSSIGCSIEWNQTTQTVVTRKGATEVDIPVGKSQIVINQKIVPIDTAAVLKNGRTFLPLRAVFEAYTYTVTWEDQTKTINATSIYTPYNINGGTTGIFSRKQLQFTGFDGIQADVTLPTVKLGQKGDCPYVYFGFDWTDDKGNAEGGFQFIEDSQNPGYNKWTVFLRQGNVWSWGDNILLEQGSTHNLKFYAVKVSETQTDLVIDLDGREIVRKPSAVNNFDKASVKSVVAMAMSVPFDGTNCPSSSVGARIKDLTASEFSRDSYNDIALYDLYREYKNGIWYGTVDCTPDYLYFRDDGAISISSF
ncbi:MAG TPA: copper amine oxidase N-terminal domain-containing protein [Anaerovoracaceae bacterium]|nr:copper amine oxidase N-terminal domain-containing protein [Anaerovoracaceae bacterium]